MLEIRNCILASPGVEIHVPSGVTLLEPEDVPFEAGISVRSRDKMYRMIWQITDSSDGTTEEGLKVLMEDIQPRSFVIPISPIELNGLSGHCVAYNMRCSGNYEARFSLPNGRQLWFYIITKAGLTIDALMQTQDFATALNAIRKAD